jgi:GYF domain 2
MTQVVWHLSRGPGHQTVISDEALRRLAELGKVDANDLLWRPGFHSWIPAWSVSGLVTPPPMPVGRSDQIDADAKGHGAHTRPDFAEIPLWSRLQRIATLIRHHLTTQWWRLSLHAKDWGRATRLHIRVYARGVYRHLKRVELGVETLLSRKEHHRILGGILAACVLVGTVVAMHEAPADAQLAPQNSGSIQPNAAATAATCANRIESERHPLRQEAVLDRSQTDHAFSIVSLQLSDELGAVSIPVAEALSNSAIPPTSEIPRSDPVPLPTRKPMVPIKSLKTVGNERTGSAVRRKAATTQKRSRQPKVLPFGTIGFNYSDPAL